MITRRKAGRPRVLDPVYHRGMCDRVMKVGKRGGSRTAMALACGVCRVQLRRWTRRHPEFAVAYELANTYAEVYWLELGAAHLEDVTFNDSVWLRIMNSRFDHPDRHLRFRGRKDIAPVAAATIITRVITRSGAKSELDRR